MFVHVKFVNDFGDSSKVNVPSTYVKNFDPKNIDYKKTYDVFWSPNSDEGPEDYPNELGSVGHSSVSEGSAGYYKALILQCAETEEALEHLMEKTRVRVPTKRLVQSPLTSLTEDKKMSKRDVNKATKNIILKGKVENLKTIMEKTKTVKPVFKKRLDTLFVKEDESISDSSLFDDSDDDVVPTKIFKKSEKTIDDQRLEIKQLKGKNKKLKEEKEECEKRYRELKKKYDDLLKLNHEVQQKILTYFEEIKKKEIKKTPTSFRSSDYDIMGASSSSWMSSDNYPYHFTDTLETPTKKATTPSSTVVRPSNSSAIELDNNNEEDLTPPIAQPDTDKEEFFLPKEKLDAAKHHIKRGMQGDSQYTKNLAAAIWPPQILSSRSVTGRKGNFKGKEAKDKLTPRKLHYLTDLFKKRILEENPQASEDEINLRMKNIPTYISQKIATLNRVAKLDI